MRSIAEALYELDEDDTAARFTALVHVLQGVLVSETGAASEDERTFAACWRRNVLDPALHVLTKHCPHVTPEEVCARLRQ